MYVLGPFHGNDPTYLYNNFLCQLEEIAASKAGEVRENNDFSHEM